MSEHDEQVTWVEWCKWKSLQDSRYDNFFAVPNGIHARKSQARKCKAEGLRKGFPDTGLLWPNDTFKGLFLEFKVKPNKPSDEQLDWIHRLTLGGYLALVVWSATEAIEITEHYMKSALLLPDTLEKPESSKNTSRIYHDGLSGKVIRHRDTCRSNGNRRDNTGK